MFTLIIVSAILLLSGFIILIGKGDKLIAGYNTASEEEKAQYSIKRLRGLIGGMLLVLGPITFILLRMETMAATLTYLGLTFVLTVVVIILANTWAKEKK